MHLIKQNGITTDANNPLNHPTSTNIIANSSTNVNTTQANSAPIATQAANTNAVAEVLTSNAVTEVDGSHENATDAAEQEPEPEIDIVINNVVCSFSVRCHLNLREIALNGRNVEFRRENGMVTMKLRRPYTTASIWSSGRITCTGATSEDQVSIENYYQFKSSLNTFSTNQTFIINAVSNSVEEDPKIHHIPVFNFIPLRFFVKQRSNSHSSFSGKSWSSSLCSVPSRIRFSG